jgi:hypothetical protein
MNRREGETTKSRACPEAFVFDMQRRKVVLHSIHGRAGV